MSERGVERSIVFAVGPPTSTDYAGISWAVAQAAFDDRTEVIVVADHVAAGHEPMLRLACAGARVLHSHKAYGLRGALAAGAALAEGDVIVLMAPDARVIEGNLDALIAGFGNDPGVGLVAAHERSGEASPATASPVVAIGRSALDSIGGAAALEADDAHSTAPLVSAAVRDALARAGWRSRIAAGVVVAHTGGQIVSWPRDPDATLRATERPSWVPVPVTTSPRPGVNVVGLFEAACGLGEAARRYGDALAAGGVSSTTLPYHGHRAPELAFQHRGPRELAFDTTLFALNADALARFADEVGVEFWAQRYAIGLWFWEIEAIPQRFIDAARLVNEIWVSSHFLAEPLAHATRVPVVVVPFPVELHEGEPSRTRAELGLPEEFTFVSVFDFDSLAARKNPFGTVAAFTRAFRPGEGPVLVVKTMNASHAAASAAELRRMTNGRRDIVILDGYASDEVVSELGGRADCFVSLHRAEGFGLPLADAMCWGRPAIATGYSGNLEFMNEDNSFLVPHTMVPVPSALDRIYPPGSRWAEPDLDAAAALMRHVAENPADAAERGRRGYESLRATNSTAAVARAISTRLGAIEELRGITKERLGPGRRAA